MKKQEEEIAKFYEQKLPVLKREVNKDIINSSGSTGCAAVLEGFKFIGIEMEEEYFNLAEARIKYWSDK